MLSDHAAPNPSASADIDDMKIFGFGGRKSQQSFKHAGCILGAKTAVVFS